VTPPTTRGDEGRVINRRRALAVAWGGGRGRHDLGSARANAQLACLSVLRRVTASSARVRKQAARGARAFWTLVERPSRDITLVRASSFTLAALNSSVGVREQAARAFF
jgi:hypothetical protein